MDIDKSGATASHIFRGAVELRSIADVRTREGGMIRMLREGQSGRVEQSGKLQVTIDDTSAAESHFVRLMPKRNGFVWAQLRPDYDRHVARQGESGDACIPDSFGTGAWGFFSSHTENPADDDAELQALTYATTANHYRNAGSYVALGQWWDLPGVKNAQLIADSPYEIDLGITEEAPPPDSIALHPGYEKERRQYLVVRWKPGKGEEGGGPNCRSRARHRRGGQWHHLFHLRQRRRKVPFPRGCAVGWAQVRFAGRCQAGQSRRFRRRQQRRLALRPVVVGRHHRQTACFTTTERAKMECLGIGRESWNTRSNAGAERR